MQVTALFKNNLLNEGVNLFLTEWNNSSPFVMVRTSGSTGAAKFIQIEKAKMIVSAKKTLNHFNIQKNSKVLLCLSPETIGGKMMIVRCIIGELNLCIGKLNANPLEEIEDIFDFSAMVPMQIMNTIDKVPNKLRNIKKIIVGGALLPNQIEDKISNLNPNVYHTFGMTETLSHFAIRHVGIDMPNVYQAIEGVRFSCKDNQLIVNYPGILDTALETKELIELIDDKKFKWIGRSDFTINSGGIKIIPEIIETKIDSILNWPFFIASLPDEYLGEKVILVIETESEVNMSKEDFASKLIRYEIPKEIFVLHQFVRTASGKINRLETIKQIKHAGFKIL